MFIEERVTLRLPELFNKYGLVNKSLRARVSEPITIVAANDTIIAINKYGSIKVLDTFSYESLKKQTTEVSEAMTLFDDYVFEGKLALGSEFNIPPLDIDSLKTEEMKRSLKLIEDDYKEDTNTFGNEIFISVKGIYNVTDELNRATYNLSTFIKEFGKDRLIEEHGRYLELCNINIVSFIQVSKEDFINTSAGFFKPLVFSELQLYTLKQQSEMYNNFEEIIENVHRIISKNIDWIPKGTDLSLQTSFTDRTMTVGLFID